MGKHKKRNNNNNNEPITKVQYVLPESDKDLSMCAYRMLQAIQARSQVDLFLATECMNIYNEYFNDEQTAALEEEYKAILEQQREKRYEKLKLMKEKGQELWDKYANELKTLMKEPMEFGGGAYKLTPDGKILSKAKGWKELSVRAYENYVREHNFYYVDFHFEATIQGVRMRSYSLLLLIASAIKALKENKTLEDIPYYDVDWDNFRVQKIN